MLLYGATCLFYALFIARGNSRSVCVRGRRRARNVKRFLSNRPIYIIYNNMITYRVLCLFKYILVVVRREDNIIRRL